MTLQLNRWLAALFTSIDSVRTAKADEELITIQTWSGVVIHVYVVENPIKARAVKKIVSENTRVGIGTLFIVNDEIVPEHGDQSVPDEGLLALHALFNEKLYTYHWDDEGELKIGQVHFKAFNRGDQRESWHGPDVPIRNLPCYKVWVNTPQSIKGSWLIANFASEAFWRQSDYIASRDAARQKKRRAEGSPRQYEWSNNPAWSTEGSASPFKNPIPQKPESELERSYRVLGLAHDATSEDVKTAFRRLAREVHPDVSQLPKAEAEAKFSTLYKAYTFIKTAKGW
jgi:hypothetical protein